MALKTALYDLHAASSATFIEFCGYMLPVSYKGLNIPASVLHTRAAASLFDVSHMGQLRIHGKDREAFIERISVANMKAVKNDSGTLSVMLREDNAGILDDTIITKRADVIEMVVNAGCKVQDIAHIKEQVSKFKGDVQLEVREGQSLVALQGPFAHRYLKPILESATGAPALEKVSFLQSFITTIPRLDKNARITVSRLGYTGEDGFEISVPDKFVNQFCQMLLDAKLQDTSAKVEWAGLGARDVLRLEAGLCLMGHDMNPEINPWEANLGWLIGKRRRQEKGFLGDAVLFGEQAQPKQIRVGLVVDGMPAREGAVILGEGNGKITSGCPSPCAKLNIAMGYVDTKQAVAGTKLKVQVRNKELDAVVTEMPFVPTRYYRAPKE
ncbi:mitochondrial glycine cleavage system T-protein aminomethyl transferase GcsT [Andalucia godoyi]|uniref:Aminomethyltransferase n=1 Tax=Andalucia godoyi TaxID=505711 RepID=A0A8K0AJN9_ANDGO|nr:mitochondrial glycine cleavage system T-protein aminomethyl transferase GcsT [Andalucia godoyi]|eukprot:ANDGO_03077.mRNA.1 mitochondrial glycine cleavage system T-protein aminomethyl transferase GcsT